MTLLADYRDARRAEDVARVRRVLALRALLATGSSQRKVAEALGVSQPAVSQQLAAAHRLEAVVVETLVEAAGPVLVRLAEERGFSRLAVFGSVARGETRPESDVDLLVEAPTGATIADVQRLRVLYEQVLGRPVDLVTYGGLDPIRDADILREAVQL